MGSAHALMAPYQTLPTADGWITIGAEIRSFSRNSRSLKSGGDSDDRKLREFNRQVREIDGVRLVVYTGGFASAGVVDFLSKVLRAVPSDIPFLHWSDIDAGGLRIFRYLEDNLPRHPQTHLMSRELAEASATWSRKLSSLGLSCLALQRSTSLKVQTAGFAMTPDSE
jgi:hypothetical protein